MNDLDFRSQITREKFEELAAPYLQRMRAPLEKVRSLLLSAPHCRLKQHLDLICLHS